MMIRLVDPSPLISLGAQDDKIGDNVHLNKPSSARTRRRFPFLPPSLCHSDAEPLSSEVFITLE